MKTNGKMWGLRLAVLLCGAGLVVASARAQDAPPPSQDGQQQGGRGMRMDPSQRAAMLQRQLGLTDDVTAKVKDIFTDGTAKMEALRGNSSLSRDDMRTQMMAIHTDETTKVKALLTPDQAAKYDEMESHRRGRGMGGPPPDGGGQPPQQ
ncbi:hypothetical protein GOB94_04645 [Granulicella sp. 5B5]|uniref:hypothetical protein n=1 Tax=Granulicella sp. 5B5 TaxID=1617967 RepID=UPI0015F75D38|nr:hypothetical protein [Granulicella sp. 5B5]QMV18056.1 hypothetical protein GOB94_04645 [Granulicella sp. 5B5]